MGRGGAFPSQIILHSRSVERRPFLSLHGSSLPAMLVQQPPAWGKPPQGWGCCFWGTPQSPHQTDALAYQLPKATNFKAVGVLSPGPFPFVASPALFLRWGDAEEGKVLSALMAGPNCCVFLTEVGRLIDRKVRVHRRRTVLQLSSEDGGSAHTRFWVSHRAPVCW